MYTHTHTIKFHELLGFCDFWGILDIKVKMQYLVQCTRTRVARKNLSVMLCTGLHGFALDQPSISGIGPINRSEKMKRSETVGNGRKRSETVGNGRKHDQAKTCPTRISLKKHFRATQFFF